MFLVKEKQYCYLVLKAQGELILIALTSSEQMSARVFWEELWSNNWLLQAAQYQLPKWGIVLQRSWRVSGKYFSVSFLMKYSEGGYGVTVSKSRDITDARNVLL